MSFNEYEQQIPALVSVIPFQPPKKYGGVSHHSSINRLFPEDIYLKLPNTTIKVGHIFII